MSYIVKEAVITVPYSEDTIQGNIGTDRIAFTRTFRCEWADWTTLIRDLMGWSAIVGNDIIIHLNHPYQPAGLLCEIRCTEIMDIRGFGGLVASPKNDQIAEYETAIVTARYTTPEYDIRTDNPSIPLISESIEPVTEFITLNYKNLFWDASQEHQIGSAEAPGAVIRMWDWIYRIHRALLVPSALIELIGCTNNASVYSRSLDMTFAPETLLLGNPSLQREHTTVGLTMFTITVRLTVNKRQWNYYPRTTEVDGEGNMIWSRIYNENGDMVRPIPFANFSEVII